MVMLRHINRNGYKLQEVLNQLKEKEQREKEQKEQEERKIKISINKELKNDMRKLSSYGKAAYVNMSPCYSCMVKKFCKASGIKHYSISERDCRKIKKFIAMKLYINKIVNIINK